MLENRNSQRNTNEQKKEAGKRTNRRARVIWLMVLVLLTEPVLAPMALAQGPAVGFLVEPPPPAMPARVNLSQGPKEPVIFKPTLSFSENPTDLELSTARVFLEPLAAMPGESIGGENRALANSLLSLKSKTDLENVSDLTEFLAAYPESRWRPSIELNLGVRRQETGYLSDALKYFKSAWDRAKDAKEENEKAVADMAISNLVLLEARLGYKNELEGHLAELKDRSLVGSAEANVKHARDGLWCMQHRPEIAYLCGPLAVSGILTRQKGVRADNQAIRNARSIDKGTNLAELKTLAEQVGLDFRVAKRSAGSPVVVPSVMHWKVGHFAAIIAQHNGLYQINDPTFGTAGNLWITRRALDAETDGYFLVPDGSLPQGWHGIGQEEAQTVWGKGFAEARDESKPPTDPKQCMGTNCDCRGLAQASAFSMQASLNIQDIPLSYQTPVGPPMDFLANYNYLEQGQPGTFAFPNFGTNWSFNWVSYLTLSGTMPNATVRVRGGGLEIYKYMQPDNVSNPYPPNLTSQATLTIAAVGVYVRTLPDGTREIFNQADGAGRIFMTQVVSPRNVSSYITYDSNFRITAITDSVGSGQVSTIGYASNTFGAPGYYKIVSITDPFSRSTNFGYDLGLTYLMTITDVIGLSSLFIYGAGADGGQSFITAMTTPYGTTSFSSYKEPSGAPVPYTGLKFNFPDGTSSVIENWLGEDGNTYFWDREAMARYPSDAAMHVFSHSKKTHWLYVSPAGLDITELPVIAFVKLALENETTYQYEGEVDEHNFTGPNNLPIEVTRTVSGSTTQTWNYKYNPFGYTTQSIDPVGRKFDYKYAGNNIDLLEIRQTRGSNNDLIGKWQYNNTQHVPNVYIDGSGQKTQYAYNSFGELTTTTDANNNVWTRNYNANGFLISIDGPLAGSQDITTFSYDGFGRLYQETNSTGYTLTFSYDNADRLTKISYMDGSSDEIVYNKLDGILFKDRIGRWSQRAYDSMDQLVFEIDPLGRKTQYAWCACGSLATLTDPAANVTTWNHDLQGRVIKKIYADNTAVSTVYDAIGRLQSRTDAMNQTTNFAYNLDNTLAQKSYTNPVNPTSTVNFTYDPNYLRLSTVQNGWGTITDTYNPYITDPFATPITGGGRLSTVANSVIPNSTVSYSYDALGRTTNRSINGSSNSTTWTFDAMSRVTAESNPLGSFAYNYVDNTSGSSKGTLRLSSINYPNSQVTKFNWYSATFDERLLDISNFAPSGSPRSQFSYAYNSAGEITRWAQQNAGYTPVNLTLGYDLAGQLISANGASGNQLPVSSNQHHYSYDVASNRAAVQQNIIQTARIGGTVTASDTLTIAVQDAALTGGQQAVNYVVQSGDTTPTIAAGLAAAITANANLQTLGVNAGSSSSLITIKSASPNVTTFTQSTSGGATETITLGVNRNSIQNARIGGTKTTGDILTITVFDSALGGGQQAVNYTVLSGDNLTSIATGIKTAINANANLQAIGVSATSASTVVSIKSNSANLTTYTQSISSGATETITLAMNMNLSQTAVIGGSKATGDTVTINVYDAGLTGGQKAINYTVLSGDTLTTIASGLASAINADTSLQAIGVSATSASTVITLNSNSVNVTAYTGSRSSFATETVVVGINSNGTQTAAIGGTKTTGDVLTITVFDAALTGGSKAINYTVLVGDTLTSIASGVASAINADTSLQAIGVTATAVSTVVNIKSTSIYLTSYTQSKSAGATETITLGPSAGITQSLYNNVNELVSIVPGGSARFGGATNKAVKSAAIGTQVLYIQAPPPTPTTYTQSTSPGATETITFGININNVVTATIGGTKTTGDVLKITAQNKYLPDGNTVSYVVQASDTLTSIATALASAINSNSLFQQTQVTATSSGATLTITANPPRYTLLPGTSTETMTAGPNVNGNMTVTIGGTKTTGDSLTINVNAAGIFSPPAPVVYTVLAGDTLTSIAAGLANAINNSAALQAIGLRAANGSAVLDWSQSFSGTGILPSGASTATASAVDGGSNTKTNPYQYGVPNPASQNLTFDANGNMTSDGGTNTYLWDAENRLIQINYPGSSTRGRHMNGFNLRAPPCSASA